MRAFVILVACYLTYLPLFAATETFTWVVHFETDVDTPNAGESALLRGFLANFSPRDDLRVTVVGHADLRGTNAYNRDLADRRCKEVWEIISCQKLTITQHVLEVKGEEAPLVKGTASWALEQNRRVEVIVERVSFTDLRAFEDELAEPNLHVFKGDAGQPSHFICSRGSSVEIQAKTLCDAAGVPYNGSYTLRVVEAIDPLSFFANKLSTVSDDRILVSGGMMKIEAFTEAGEPLSISEGSAARVNIPTADFNSDMTLFVSEDGGNWMDTQQPPQQPDAVFKLPEMPEEVPCPIWVAPRRMKLPAEPARPVLTPRPVVPVVRAREVSYREYPWWCPGKRKDEEKKHATLAEVNHERLEKAFDRYEKQLRRYEQDSANFGSKVAAYNERMKKWEVECDSIHALNEKAAFASLERFKNSSAECYEKRRLDAALWQAMRDSLKNVQVTANAVNTVVSYTFSVTGFGWINCDRFWARPVDTMMDFVVQLAPGTPTNSVLIIDDIDSVVNLRPDTNGLAKARLPKGAKARIVSCFVENDRLFLATETFSGKASYVLEYKHGTMEGLVELFEEGYSSAGLALTK